MPEKDKDQQRLERLRNELGAWKSRDEQASAGDDKQHDTQDSDNMRRGMLAGTEFVGAIIAGGAIGYVLDVGIGTWPVLFLIWLLLGIMTGFYNIHRITNNIAVEKPFQALHDEKKNDNTHMQNHNNE